MDWDCWNNSEDFGFLDSVDTAVDTAVDISLDTVLDISLDTAVDTAVDTVVDTAFLQLVQFIFDNNLQVDQGCNL